MILQDVKPFDNATLERVRHIDTTVRRSPSKHSPMPAAAAARMKQDIEESVRPQKDKTCILTCFVTCGPVKQGS